MAREELAEASDRLESAAETASDQDDAGRLDDLSDQLQTLADRDTDPDHGRLARIQNALSDVREGTSDAVREAIDDAKDLISKFREGVEGV